MKLLIIFALFGSSLSCVSHKVKIDILYESLCPDSMRFISDHLKPLYDDFKKNLEITFYPFGKSLSTYNEDSQKVEFRCQHGPEECFGNRMQACVLNRLNRQDEKMNYVACQMKIGSDVTHRECVEALGWSYDEIVECAESDFALRQQLGYEIITNQHLIVTNWVPTVIYNGELDDMSITRDAPPLKTILCTLIDTHQSCVFPF